MNVDFEMLRLILDRTDSLNGYWNIYMCVALGVLGLMASGKPFTREARTKFLLSLGFLVFAVSNMWAIIATNRQLRVIFRTLWDSLWSVKGVIEKIERLRPLMPEDNWKVVVFHVLLDLIVVLCISLVRWGGNVNHSGSRDQEH